jgi:exocyst complex protein 7
VSYLERLPEVRDAVGVALLILGDGNWKMGEGTPVGKGSNLGEGDEAMVIEHYTCQFCVSRLLFFCFFLFRQLAHFLPDDVISTALSSLSALAKAHKRPTFGSVLFLNNVTYLFRRIVISPKSSALSSLLAKPSLDLLNSNSRIAKAGYFDANFSPLLTALTDDPRERAMIGRSSTKDKLTRFYDLLEEVVERHKIARVLEDDVEIRNQMTDEVVKLVVPSLQRFTQKHRDKSELSPLLAVNLII